MRQLQLFTVKELAAMRDRTRSRSYSPAKDEFRREHERHRNWGLTHRHAEKLRRIHATAPQEEPRPQQAAPAPPVSPAPVEAPRPKRLNQRQPFSNIWASNLNHRTMPPTKPGVSRPNLGDANWNHPRPTPHYSLKESATPPQLRPREERPTD